MKTCPDCGATMEKITAGVISEPVTLPNTNRADAPFTIERRARLATFYACTGCEHYEEK